MSKAPAIVVLPSVGRTQFQTDYINKIAQRPDFVHFCSQDNGACVEPYRGPFLLLFITADDKLHCHHVGQKRLIKVVV